MSDEQSKPLGNLAEVIDLAMKRAAIDPPTAELLAIEQREARADLLSFAKPAITTEDHKRIVEDKQDETRAILYVRHWLAIAQGKRRSPSGAPLRVLALIGSMGRGKTVAACYALAREPGHYVAAQELSKRLLSGHWRDAEWRESILRSRLVVVDDLGTERDQQDARAALHELVNKRQVARALTLLTGNLTEAELVERYDPRTIDRIRHVGAIFELKGPSLRRGKPR